MSNARIFDMSNVRMFCKKHFSSEIRFCFIRSKHDGNSTRLTMKTILKYDNVVTVYEILNYEILRNLN